MNPTVRAVLALGAMTAALGAANARELDPQIRQLVITNCSDDAYRLCPQSLGSEADAVNCMKSKRSQLKRTCRATYDKVVRVLAH